MTPIAMPALSHLESLRGGWTSGTHSAIVVFRHARNAESRSVWRDVSTDGVDVFDDELAGIFASDDVLL